MMSGLVSPTQHFANTGAFVDWYGTILPISLLKKEDQIRLGDAYTLSIELARAEGRYFGRSEEEWQQRCGGDRSLALDQFIEFFGKHGYTLVPFEGLMDKSGILPEKRNRAYELLCRNVLPDKFLITAEEFCRQMNEAASRLGELQVAYQSATSDREKTELLAQMTSELTRMEAAYQPRRLEGYFL
jgi:hypothetical protein